MKLFICLSIAFLCLCDTGTTPFESIKPVSEYTADGGPIVLSEGLWHDCYQYILISDHAGGIAKLGTTWQVKGTDSEINQYVDSSSVDWDTCWCTLK